MTKTEINKFRLILEKKKSELQSLMGNNEGIKVDGHAKKEGMDGVVEESGRALELDLHQRSFQRLREVEDALVRTVNGNFGQCGDCQEPINTKRLYAVPWATRCLDCQEAYENESAAQQDTGVQQTFSAA